MVHTTASSQSMPFDVKCIPTSDDRTAYSSTRLHSRISFTLPFPATVWSRETRYDRSGLTCRAIQASDATTDRNFVTSSALHEEFNDRLDLYSIGDIFSVLPLRSQ